MPIYLTFQQQDLVNTKRASLAPIVDYVVLFRLVSIRIFVFWNWDQLSSTIDNQVIDLISDPCGQIKCTFFYIDFRQGDQNIVTGKENIDI